jgi:hypothetical protein
LQAERINNAAAADAFEFRLNLKKREIENAGHPSDVQRQELIDLTRNLHIQRHNVAQYDSNVDIIDSAQREREREREERWKKAWMAVDRVLDTVWMDAVMLRPYDIRVDDPAQDQQNNQQSNQQNDQQNNQQNDQQEGQQSNRQEPG